MTALEHDPPFRDDETTNIGFAIFLGSWLMLFAGLFFSYGLIRSRMDFWPPVDLPAPPLFLTGMATITVAVSSAFVHASYRALRKQQIALSVAALFVTALLGALFLSLQIRAGFLANQQGLRIDTGPYASILYALAGTHAAHVVVGVIALLGLSLKVARGGTLHQQRLRLWATYWHSVGLVWAVIYLFVFVL